MKTNALPNYDMSDNPTNCCPRFKPADWEEQQLHFENKLFLKVKTRSIFYLPINIGSVFSKTMAAIEKADAFNDNDFIILSTNVSAWTSEHYFAVTKEIPGHDMARLSGDYLTKVFEGPYKNVPGWEKQMQQYVKEAGKQLKKTYFFYTTCPKCAKFYNKNYVVAVSETQTLAA